MRLFMCMHAKEVFVFFQIRSIKNPVTIFKNGCKKIVFITKCNEKKLFETHYSLEKNCLQVPKMVTPPPPRIKIMVHPLGA